MSQLDDAQLAEHLARRAMGGASGAELARGIEQLAAGTPQERPRAWERLLPSGVPSRRDAVFPALSAALGVVVLLAAANLVRAPSGQVQPSPRSTTTSTWLLDLAQLEQALERVDMDGTNLGGVVVANVALSGPFPGGAPGPATESLPAGVVCTTDGVGGPRCPSHYVVTGSNPPITVLGVPATVPCESGRCPTEGSPGPFALGLHGGHVVQYFSPVRLHAGGAVPWTVDEFIDSTSTEPMVVDGWLSGIGALPCPLDSRQPNGFECGPASWITSESFDPTVTPGPSSDGFGFQGPTRGIRVENGASSMIAAPGMLASGGAAIQPRRGLYLVNRLPIDATQCFLCSSTNAFVAAEITPIDVSVASATVPDPPTSVPGPTSPTTDGPAGFWTGAQLASAVHLAQTTGSGTGRVVVADVAFEAVDACAEQPFPPSCSVIVSGSDPPITLRDAQAECPSGFFCADIPVPIVPHDGPFALRILGDGSVSFVGYVDPPVLTSLPESATWLFDFLRNQLSGATGSQVADYRLVVVSGWISGAAGEPKCLQRSTPDSRFGCGDAAWLTGDPVQPNTFSANEYSLRAPTQSIRLPNGAYAAFAADPTPPGPQVVPETEYGTFLVRAVIPPLTSCFLCDGPAVEVIARLDPAAGQAVAPTPVPSSRPGPESSLTAEAAYALAYAEKFEDVRAHGDWPEAWLLLGPASKAAFGSLQAFIDAETAYNASGATVYQITDPTQDPDLLSESNLGDFGKDIVLQTAWYVGINHPDVVGASAGNEGLVIGTGIDGGEHVWIVH